MQHLNRLEDLTRRYAKTRLGGAGLGSLWALIMTAVLAVLVWNHIQAEFLASGNTYSSLWRLLGSDTLVTPSWLKVATITTSVFTWLGVSCLQLWVDKQLGVAIPNDPTAKVMRFLTPSLFIVGMLCTIGFNIGRALAIHDNIGVSVFDNLDISSYLGWAIITAWGVIWAFSSRDTLSRGLACVLTVMLFPLMSSTLNKIDFIAFIPQFLALLVFAIVGIKQFLAFKNVRNEINALSAST
ncbi:MAG: hypothetical protein ACREPB_16065 [Arenimonas sp.]